jgi:hypothetical protein
MARACGSEKEKGSDTRAVWAASVLSEADGDVAPVLKEVLQHLLEGEHLRPVVHDRQQDDAEGALQRGVLEELVEDDLLVAVPLDLHDDPHPLAV